MSYLDKAKGVAVKDPDKLVMQTKSAVYERNEITNKAFQMTQTPLNPLRNNLLANIPRLPWQLERLVSAAACDQLPQDPVILPSGLIPNLNRYTLGWAAAYLVGDRQEALSRLWQVRRIWQGEALS